MLVTFMPTAIFAEDEGENISLLLNNGKLVAEKISNPTHGEREADGLVEVEGGDGDRMNSYAWSMTRLGDYVYIGSNRNLIYSAVYSELNRMITEGEIELASSTDLNKSMETLAKAVDVATAGDVYTDCTIDQFVYAVIVRYNIKDGTIEKCFDAAENALDNPFYNDSELFAIGNNFVTDMAQGVDVKQALYKMVASTTDLYKNPNRGEAEPTTKAAITCGEIIELLEALQDSGSTGEGLPGLPEKLIYTPKIPIAPYSNIIGFRAAQTFKNKAIFNATYYGTTMADTTSGFLAITETTDGAVSIEPVFTNVEATFSLRAMGLSKDGNTLYIAGASKATSGEFSVNLFKSEDGETLEQIAPAGTEPGTPIGKLPAEIRSFGGDVWDVIEYNGDLFVTVMTLAGAVVYRGSLGEDGWTFTVFAGNEEINGEAGEDAVYPIGFGVPEYYAVTPVEFKGDLYFLTFANAYDPVFWATEGVLFSYLKKDISVLFKEMESIERSFDKQTAIYRLTKDEAGNEILQMVVGDRKDIAPKIQYKATKGSGFNNKDFGTTLYNWRAAVYNGQLYVGTFDSYQLLKLTTIFTNGDLLQLDAETFSNELDEILELLDDLTNLNVKQYEGLKTYIVQMQQMLKLTEPYSTEAINWFLSHIKEIKALVKTLEGLAFTASSLSKLPVVRSICARLAFALGGLYHTLDSIDVEGLSTYVRVSKTIAANDNPGFELYRTNDGIHYETLAVNGFNDKYNYGVRTLLPIENEHEGSGLLLGTANPFYGAQLWKIVEFCDEGEHVYDGYCDENGYGRCVKCGWYCFHDEYIDGICTTCGHKCQHEDHGTDCICTVCGKTGIAHTYSNGVCTVCGYECTHSWSNGKCTVCGVTCNHPSHDQKGVCAVCGKTGIAHTYSKGVCTVCGAAEPKPQPQIIIWDTGYSAPSTPAPKKYVVNVTKGVTADVVSAAKGDTVTLMLDALYRVPVIKDANGKVISYSRNGKTIAFTMPDSEVTITVMCSRDANCPLTVYDDIDLSRWYHDGIQYCLENNIMQGLTDTSFGVNSPATRGQFITMIWRIAGAPRVTGVDLKFKDIKTTAFYMDALRWAIKNNIITGITEDTFGPYVEVTREQIATMLYRYANLKGEKYEGNVNSILPYVDVNKIGKFSNEAVHWAVEEGLLKGKTATELDPKGIATRAEAAGLTQRFCER